MKVGIDIGTSYSSICFLNKEGKAEPVKVDTGLSIFGNEYLLPSAVFLQDNIFLVGQAACNMRAKNLKNYKTEFKRHFGQDAPLTIGNKSVLPEELYKELLIHLKERTEHVTGEPISYACITHPATFTTQQKELLTKIAHDSGLLNVELLEEPVAAAFNYLSENEIKEGKIILIYDFGGGTFDAALLNYKKGHFEILTSPVGLERCGGIDFDHEIYDEIIKTIPKEAIERVKSNEIVYRKLMVHLFELSVQAKHHLSSSENFESDIATGLDSIEFSIDVVKYNSFITRYIDDSVITINDLLTRAGLNNSDIDKIVLVGGTCNVPLVRQKIEKIFPGKIYYPVNPELSIAKGAAIKTANHNVDNDEFFIYCSVCKKIRLTKNAKCSICGKKADIPEFIRQDMERKYLKSLTEFIRQVNENAIYETDNLINATVENYVETMRFAKGMASHKELTGRFTNHLIHELDTFLQRCVSNEFHVAIIGTIKSGKSTLINALLERELASTSVTPETAVLTKFRSSKSKDYVKVIFYNAEEWRELWISIKESGDRAKIFIDEYRNLNANELEDLYISHEQIITEYFKNGDLKEFVKKWSSSKSPEHYFVKEIEIGLTAFDIPDEIVFVDTPGLNDPVPYRSNITRNYIGRANLVLVCVKGDSLTGEQLDIIYRVFGNTRYNPEKVFVIGTQVDALNDPLQDWTEQKDEWIKYLKGESCFGNYELANQHLLHVSAYLYTILLKYKEDKNTLDKRELKILNFAKIKFEIGSVDNKPEFEKLLDLTNLRQIRTLLFDKPLKNVKRDIVIDITEQYKSLKIQVSESYQNIVNDYNDYMKVLTEGIDKVSILISEKKQTLAEVNKEQDEMTDFLIDFKKNCKSNVNELISCIKQNVY